MIYLDYCATSAPFESVLEVYKDINTNHFGNPSSLHFYGYESKKLLEEARNGILSLLNVDKVDNLIFTSSATEANNLVLKGVPFKYKNRGNRIITSLGEHPSILNPLIQMKELFGFKVDYVPLKGDGEIDLEAFRSMMGDDVILVSIMGVNNETGAINPVKDIANIIKSYPKCFFHSDLTQAILSNCIIKFLCQIIKSIQLITIIIRPYCNCNRVRLFSGTSTEQGCCQSRA